jgi:hypothetical protein
MSNLLLVEPKFPIPNKSKNHHNFIPIGLLKIASLKIKEGHQVRLIRGFPKNDEELHELQNFEPNEIWVSSLFTYWSKYVKEVVDYYGEKFPDAWIKVGGIYASLRPENEVLEYIGCDEVIKGVIPEAEECEPAYYMLNNINEKPIDYQILHTSRGCMRKCSFCGTWKIEPEFLPLESIKDRICYKKLVFYDNNFFMNPYAEHILDELIDLKKHGKIQWCESQSGFDGRLLIQKPELAVKLKKAGFRYPRIAWDWGYDQWTEIEKQKNVLINGGYSHKDIYIFVLYNWNLSFEEMEKKRIKCFEWKVQIADCRYRPLDLLDDMYNPRKVGQTEHDYFIHPRWKDDLVKQYRRNVRQQNICVRHDFELYCKILEHKKADKGVFIQLNELKTLDEKKKFLKVHGIDYWQPDQTRYPMNDKLKNIDSDKHISLTKMYIEKSAI